MERGSHGERGRQHSAYRDFRAAPLGGVGWSAASGMGASSHSPVLLQQRDHISDSPGVAFGGVELVSELNKIASSLLLSSASRSSSFSSRYRLHRPSATAAARSRSAPRRRRSLDANLLCHGRRHGRMSVIGKSVIRARNRAAKTVIQP
jgi:hypothetical protein